MTIASVPQVRNHCRDIDPSGAWTILADSVPSIQCSVNDVLIAGLCQDKNEKRNGGGGAKRAQRCWTWPSSPRSMMMWSFVRAWLWLPNQCHSDADAHNENLKKDDRKSFFFRMRKNGGSSWMDVKTFCHLFFQRCVRSCLMPPHQKTCKCN